MIGGGNVAMDIARTMARLQKQKYGQVGVTVTALEDFDHFLADKEEVTESLEEQIEIFDARGPQEVVRFKSGKNKGKVKGLRTWKVTSIFDDQGRFAPQYDQGDEMVHPAEMVVEAIGQSADVSLLGRGADRGAGMGARPDRGRCGRAHLRALALGRGRRGARARRDPCRGRRPQGRGLDQRDAAARRGRRRR